MFAITHNGFDFIALVETWLKPGVKVSSLLHNLPNCYSEVRCDRLRKNGGGVIFICRDSLPLRAVFKESVINCYEILCCDISFGNFVLRTIGVYRVPNCRSAGDNQLFNVISDLLLCSYPCLVFGDFNFPDICWTDSPYGSTNASSSFLSFLKAHNLSQIVSQNTRASNMLDLVLTTDVSIISDLIVSSPLGTSDHCTISFDINVPIDRLISHSFPDFQAANYDAIARFLNDVDWIGSFSQCVNVDDMYELFLFVLSLAISYFVPVVTRPINSSRLPAFLEELAAIREAAWDDVKNGGSVESLNEFTRLNNRFIKKLNRYNASLDKKIIESGKPALFYNLVRKRLKLKAGIPPLSISSGTRVFDDNLKADLFAEQFASVYAVDEDFPAHEILNESVVCPTMSDSIWFSKEEILEVLVKSKKTSSTNPDGLCYTFIQRIAPFIAMPLELIFNFSFMQADVPSRWRQACVIPLPKSQTDFTVENFRPISLTSPFARIFEKIVKKRLVAHLEQNSVISVDQHGFTRGKSTVTQMLECFNDWTASLERQEAVDIIFFDFAKAFDKVSHCKLLSRLRTVGIHPRIISWISAYLKNRSFRVVVNGKFSKEASAPSGVPQGSVLAPILFNIFTFDIPTIVSNLGGSCKMFADDLKVYATVPSGGGNNVLQNVVDALLDWSKVWSLPLSPAKTKILHLGNNNPHIVYVLDGQRVSVATEVTDLGFSYDNKLQFDKHCSSLKKKANLQLLNLFRSLRTNNPSVLLKAYKTYIRPILEYGTVIFFPKKKMLINMLESVQNSFTRKLLIRTRGFDYSRIPSAAQRNLTFGLSSLESRRKSFDLLVVRKVLLGKLKLKGNFFQLYPTRTRGETYKLYLPLVRSSARASFFINRAGREYQKLLKRSTSFQILIPS